MKKLFALLLAILMIASLVACTKKPAEEPAEPGEDTTLESVEDTAGQTEADSESESEEVPGLAGLANPMTVCATLDEVNTAAGTKLVKPGDEVTDEVFTTIKGEPVLGQYQFTLSGVTYTWRAANTTNDITGIYEDAIESEYPKSNDDAAFKTTENFRISFWLVDQATQYALTAPADTDEATFKAVTNLLVALTANKAAYTALAGNYMDSFSQRASAVITDNGNNATVKVHWASSVSEYTEWTMTVTYAAGKLVYKDCEKANIVATSEDEFDKTVEYTDGEGYFELIENKLAWTGAADENCRECIFEKFGMD